VPAAALGATGKNVKRDFNSIANWLDRQHLFWCSAGRFLLQSFYVQLPVTREVSPID
jgi:hypothetical protein